MQNACFFIGRLAAEPEHKYTPGGKSVVNFRLAVNRPKKTDEKESTADFFDIIAWESTADFVANYVGKGRLVSVESRCQVRTYQDKEGNNRRVVEFVAYKVQALDRAKDDEDTGS